MSQSFIRSASKVWRLSANLLQKVNQVAKHNVSQRKVYKVKDSTLQRLRFLIANIPTMTAEHTSIIVPPIGVKGMTTLDRSAFEKVVSIPGIVLPKKDIQRTQKLWKSQQLRRRGIKPIAELSDGDPLKSTHSLLLLDPDRLTTHPFSPEAKERLGIDSEDFKQFTVPFTYANWTVPEVLRAVLPSEADNVSSFTLIGHIAHLNLREESMPFKTLIGEVILDKNAAVKTVVNKVNIIDTTFRNFQMELLAGEDSYITQLREHGCDFELDFSKVYWNSRLSAEHQRIVESIEKGSIVFDVMAGIGPFAVPLAMKKSCTCYANDLNPVSFEFLRRNIALNKIPSDKVEAFNLDGREFIRGVLKESLVKILSDRRRELLSCVTDETNSPDSVMDGKVKESTVSSDSDNSNSIGSVNSSHARIYVVMNLPGLAIEFLDAFNSLLSDTALCLDDLQSVASDLPTVHCYTFEQRSDTMEYEVRRRAESALGMTIPGDVSVRWVRNVAPKKEMLCVTFKLWPELMLGKQEKEVGNGKEHRTEEEPESKKQKLSS